MYSSCIFFIHFFFVLFNLRILFFFFFFNRNSNINDKMDKGIKKEKENPSHILNSNQCD